MGYNVRIPPSARQTMQIPSDAQLREQAQALGERLRAAHDTLVTAESCTGGWIAKCLTDIAGSSDWFDSGMVVYSYEAKQALLGVRPQTLEQHGAVSRETVIEMVSGALVNSGASVAVAVTGREQEFADAKIAVLHYRILEEINDPSPLALADVTIGTGRFHQIRVQFAHAGFPLLGDTKYGTAALKEAMPAQKYRGVALCAYSLELVHPVSGKKMGFRVVPKNPAFAGFAMEELKKLTENETGISKRG